MSLPAGNGIQLSLFGPPAEPVLTPWGFWIAEVPRGELATLRAEDRVSRLWLEDVSRAWTGSPR